MHTHNLSFRLLEEKGRLPRGKQDYIEIYLLTCKRDAGIFFSLYDETYNIKSNQNREYYSALSLSLSF